MRSVKCNVCSSLILKLIEIILFVAINYKVATLFLPIILFHNCCRSNLGTHRKQSAVIPFLILVGESIANVQKSLLILMESLHVI